MKTLLTLISFVMLAAATAAAPALPEKPVRWEYAELSYRTNPGRPALVDADGVETPAVPATVSVRWTTKDGEVEAKGWDDLATKLKATGFKKEGSAAFQKIQMLNVLGGEGWEIMESPSNSSTPQLSGVGGGGPGGGVGGRARSTSAPTTWLLKRRVP
ncbi:MAG TPA: hypothetical protein VKD72_02175 [Gemmataceae bacterium]|nr:hypothetical protein [Gemmataceae bacterium]